MGKLHTCILLHCYFWTAHLCQKSGVQHQESSAPSGQFCCCWCHPVAKQKPNKSPKGSDLTWFNRISVTLPEIRIKEAIIDFRWVECINDSTQSNMTQNDRNSETKVLRVPQNLANFVSPWLCHFVLAGVGIGRRFGWVCAHVAWYELIYMSIYIYIHCAIHIHIYGTPPPKDLPVLVFYWYLRGFTASSRIPPKFDFSRRGYICMYI